MITNKKIEKIIIILVFLGFVLSFVLIPFVVTSQNTSTAGVQMEYERKLFSKEQIISLDIQMDEASWKNLLENASQKKYYSCNIVINGETFYNIGIRAKGGSSLDDVKALGNSDRYSLMLKFNKYEKGQTCYGLDKLALNNNIGDATSMKDAITYDMSEYLGLESPLYNYANISVNGNYFGCYLALEGVDKSFCKRKYGKDYGKLYKPADYETGYSHGASLGYTDDNLNNYTGISEGAVFSSKDDDIRRIIAALKNVNAGTNTEQYVNIDNILKFMAIQTVAVNLDGLTGADVHNFYLYEKNGKLSLIPWDYNLAYGGYIEMDDEETQKDENLDDENIKLNDLGESESWKDLEFYDNTTEASKVVNLPINTPFTADFRYRTFFMKILENEAYRAKYHEYLSILATKYILGGELEKRVTKIHSQIDDIISTESNAFFTKEQYNSGVQTLLLLLQRKSLSIQGQINGSIPSTREGQASDNTNLIPCDDIILSKMGSLN